MFVQLERDALWVKTQEDERIINDLRDVNKELRRKYNDFGKDFIEKNYLIEDRNYSAEEFEDVWWHYHFTFCKEHYVDHLNNCHRGITRFFRLLIDESLKSDDPDFIQNKINEGTKKYKLLMQERFKERVEEVLKKKLDTSS